MTVHVCMYRVSIFDIIALFYENGVVEFDIKFGMLPLVILKLSVKF